MIVFGAEPLVAYYGDEPGSDQVEARIRDVESGTRRGVLNDVTCTEIHYAVARDDEDRADAYLERIRNWLQVIDADGVWAEASFFKRRYGVPLGDAFTLATAAVRDGTAFVGAYRHYDGITEVDVERFRTAPSRSPRSPLMASGATTRTREGRLEYLTTH